jgi:putative N6-adenine-specific DNA methylase
VLGKGATLRSRVTCRKSKLYHSDAVAQRVEAEIVRAVPGVLVERAGEKETDDADDEEEPMKGASSAEQLIVVRVDHDRCTISADSSGDLLHRRGYRQAIAKAPLRETLAAAMLIGAGYDASLPVADPMCGSGTLAIEAAMIARRMAPGLSRTFAAERWPETDKAAWAKARETARARILPKAAAPILASDRDAGAIDAASANAKRAGVEHDIEFGVQALSAFDAESERGLLIMNPPYGVRVGETKQLRDLYARLGQLAHERIPGWDIALLSADRGLERQTKLPLEEIFATKNGGIPVRLMCARGAESD